jgi:hypothetical protein
MPGRFNSRANAAQSGSTRRRCPFQIVLHRRARHAHAPPDFSRAHTIVVEPQ